MAFITIEGENKIALQQGNSQLLNITHFVLANIDGLGAEPADRIETLPDPADIVDTRPFTKAGYVNTNQVVYSLTLDSTVGDYTFNWVGLKDEDDVLIAVVYLADPITKTATDGGIEGNNLVRNFLLAFSGAQATTAINAPAETWQIDFTTRLLQIDERERLSNFDIYGHDAFFSGGFDVTLNAGTVFDVSPGVGYVGGIRCEFTSTQQIDVGALPNTIWVDASLQGDLTGLDADVQLVASSAPLVDYVDVNGINHYVAKIADINGGAEVTNTKSQAPLDVVPQPIAEAGTDTSIWAWTAQRVRQAIKAMVATQSETDAGTDDSKYITPKKLRWGFSYLFNATGGYIAFPSWLGGFIIQWGTVTVPIIGSTIGSSSTFSFVFPVAFPNAFLTAAHINNTGSGIEGNELTISLEGSAATSVTAKVYRVAGNNTSGSEQFSTRFIVIGH